MNRILAMLSAGLALLVQDRPKAIELPTLPTYTLSNREASGMTLRDVNGDGFPDLICSGSEGGRPAQSVMYLSNKGRLDKVSWKSGIAQWE